VGGRRVIRGGVNKLISAFCLLLCCSFSVQIVAGTSSSAADGDSTRLTYLINGSAGEPYQYLHANNDGQGIITDILTEVFRNSSYNLVSEAIPVKRVKRYMYESEFNHWLTYGFRSWATGKTQGLHFASVDLFNYRYALVGYRARNDLEALSNSNKWQGKRIVVISGFQYSGLKAELRSQGAEFIGAQDQAHALELLQRQRADFYLGNPDRVAYLWAKLDEDWKEFIAVPLGNEIPVTIMMADSFSSEFKQFVDMRLAALKREGFVDSVLTRYSVVQ
jgi:polar amino acid transport system substrate-binding protein